MINFRGVQGGRAPHPPIRVPSLRGGSFNITSSSGNLHSTLHCIALTRTKRLRKKLKYILIHNNTLQSFVWASIALNIHVSHFENRIFLFVVFLQKWLAHFLLQKRWRNEGFKGTSDMPLYKWRVTWNYSFIPFKYNYIVHKSFVRPL